LQLSENITFLVICRIQTHVISKEVYVELCGLGGGGGGGLCCIIAEKVSNILEEHGVLIYRAALLPNIEVVCSSEMSENIFIIIHQTPTEKRNMKIKGTLTRF